MEFGIDPNPAGGRDPGLCDKAATAAVCQSATLSCSFWDPTVEGKPFKSNTWVCRARAMDIFWKDYE